MQKPNTVNSRIFALAVALLCTVPVAESGAQERIRPAYTADYVAQLVDYVSRDYAGAVKNGVIIDEDEYVEQLNVIDSALEISGQIKPLAAAPEIRTDLIALIDLIRAKAADDVIKKHAQHVRTRMLAIAGVEMAPGRWPDLKKGKGTYDRRCISCHGSAGDGNGPQAKELVPKPADFLDRERMAALSPLSALSAVKHGIKNTAMLGFPDLSDEELWAVSFYVLSLRHRDEGRGAGKLDPLAAEIWLKATASLPDEELMQALPGKQEARRQLLAALRSYPGGSR